MNKILLYVDYANEKGIFWCDSYLKNKVVTVTGDIHKTVAEALLENDGMEMSYKGKPQGNIFVDDKEGNAKVVGFHYRVKKEIFNDDTRKYEKATFSAWVTVREVRDLELELLAL